METSTEKEDEQTATDKVVDMDGLVICLPRCPHDFRIGDYVFAARWADADWNDPSGVGFVSCIGRNSIGLCNEDGSRIENIGLYAFRHAIKIDTEQGKRLVADYHSREGTPFLPEIAYKILYGR